MSADRTFSASKPFLAGLAIFLVLASACSGGDSVTASNSPDGSTGNETDSADDGGNVVVANPDLSDADVCTADGALLDGGGDPKDAPCLVSDALGVFVSAASGGAL